MNKWQLTSNQLAFIEFIKVQKGFDLTNVVQNYKEGTDKCFLTDFLGDQFLAFINGRLYQRDQDKKNTQDLEQRLEKTEADNEDLRGFLMSALPYLNDEYNGYYGELPVTALKRRIEAVLNIGKP